MSRVNELKKQAKFLAYILGVHPDEFGLVPDKEGFVKIKDLTLNSFIPNNGEQSVESLRV